MLDQEQIVWHPVSNTRDQYNDGTETDGTPVTLTALVGSRSFLENADANSAGVVMVKDVYILDATAEPGASDWFEIRGQRYEMQGQAHRWSGSQVEVIVKYVGDLP
jgi:hypothetical protein